MFLWLLSILMAVTTAVDPPIAPPIPVAPPANPLEPPAPVAPPAPSPEPVVPPPAPEPATSPPTIKPVEPVASGDDCAIIIANSSCFPSSELSSANDVLSMMLCVKKLQDTIDASTACSQQMKNDVLQNCYSDFDRECRDMPDAHMHHTRRLLHNHGHGSSQSQFCTAGMRFFKQCVYTNKDSFSESCRASLHYVKEKSEDAPSMRDGDALTDVSDQMRFQFLWGAQPLFEFHDRSHHDHHSHHKWIIPVSIALLLILVISCCCCAKRRRRLRAARMMALQNGGTPAGVVMASRVSNNAVYAVPYTALGNGQAANVPIATVVQVGGAPPMYTPVATQVVYGTPAGNIPTATFVQV